MTKADAKADWDERRRILLWSGLGLGAGALLWLLGWGLLVLLAPEWAKPWHVMWGLAGISFLGAVILPIPGSTTALLAILASSILLGAAGVVGAAIGGTAGAGLLWGLAGFGRSTLARKAHKHQWMRKVLHWTEPLVHRWTYAAVGLLLMPPFLPRVVVLYPAVALRLAAVPFLVAVFLGTLVRNALYYAGIAWGLHLLSS